MGRKLGAVPLCGGGPGSPSNTMWPGPRPTCTSGFILTRLTVWPQCTNVTDRTGQKRFTNGRPKSPNLTNFIFVIICNDCLIWYCSITKFAALLDEDEGTEWPINKNVLCAVQKLLSLSRFLRFVCDEVLLNCRYVSLNNCKIKGNKKSLTRNRETRSNIHMFRKITAPFSFRQLTLA